MNILMIGNGFDLAHGLPTGYIDFLEFCKRVKRIYTYSETTSVKVYKTKQLEEWEVNDYVKKQLLAAFENRKCNMVHNGDGFNTIEVTTNKVLDELYTYINNNTWLEYFLNCPSYVGENWIDFESEISRVIQALDAGRYKVKSEGSVMGVDKNESEILVALWKAAKTSLQKVYKDNKAIREFTIFLNEELEKLIRALEIYIDEFVGKIIVEKMSEDIKKINPDHILSFNYSNTYERLYAKDAGIEYDYVHGKADVNNVIVTNNMVLGINEYLSDDRKNEDIEFIAFKKFYQRIHKATGCKYKEWVEKIVKDDNKKKPWVYDNKDHSRDNRHKLYIFGHSLDVTDKDILKDLILNDNVDTTIFYYERKDNNGNGDNGRKEMGCKIANLVKVIGQDELIKRTGGSTKTIEFKLQSDMV